MKIEIIRQLIQVALEVRKKAYAPYSNFAVGAALLTVEGETFSGCNVENASFGATNCAERTAVFKAVSEGKRRFAAIAIAGGIMGKEPVEYAYPCGVCRQVLWEFAAEDFLVIVAKSMEEYEIHTLKELLPFGFGGESIQ